MNLDLFMYRLRSALEFVENAKVQISKAQLQCQKVKDENEWLDNAYDLLDTCDLDINETIENLNSIINDSVEELKERNE